jgi:hypothetical protein
MIGEAMSFLDSASLLSVPVLGDIIVAIYEILMEFFACA